MQGFMTETPILKLDEVFVSVDDDNNVTLTDEDGHEIEEPNYIDNTANEAQLTELMALESLVHGGGLVSQSMAYQFKDHLPASHPLTSFTHLPTKVNHGIALESLGGAIKLVGLASTVALIGGLGFLVYKIIKRRKLMPKNDLDKKVSAAFVSVEEKLRAGIEELKSMYPDAKHPAFNWSREEAVIRVAGRSNFTECQAEIMGGKYAFMPDKLYSVAVEQGKEICVFLETQFLKQVESLMKRGTEDDIKELDAVLAGFKVSDNADTQLREFLKTHGIEVGEATSPIQAWTEKYDVKLEADAVKARIGTVNPSFKPMGDSGLNQMLKIQERMAKIFATLDKATKSLEGKKGEVGGNYAAKLKELVAKAKEPLSSLADVFGISDLEVKAFNGCTRVKGEAVADGFNYVVGQYRDYAQSDKPNAKAYKDCQAHIGKMFESVKSSLK